MTIQALADRLEVVVAMRSEMRRLGWTDTPALDAEIDSLVACAKLLGVG